MSTNRLGVVDKVRKLLDLSKATTNEHEAASAAEQAARLMRRHEIQEAELRLAEGTASLRTPEPIDRVTATNTRKRVAWHSTLAHAVDAVTHTHFYWHGGNIIFFGRLSAVQTAAYMLQYLIREVDRLCTAHFAPGAPGSLGSRKYRNAFRLGCARRVADRLRMQVAGDDPPAQVIDEAPAPAAGEPSPEDGVLMLIKQDRDEVEAAYKAIFTRGPRGGRTGRAGAIGHVNSADGYRAGTRAGDRANIGGGRARGGLPAGQGVLP